MDQISTPSANIVENKPNNIGSSGGISFRKIARAAAAEVRVHKKIAIITYVLYGVSLLLFMFNADFYGNEMMHFNPSGWGAVFGAMGVIVGFFAALNVFRDVNNQQLCDVTMALPIKATERFFSKLLALFYLQIGPQLVATFIGNGVAVLFGRMHYGDFLDNTTVNYMFAIVVIGLTCSLFIMAVAVLCTCCCGAPAESAYFSIILMFIINALPMTFVNYIIGSCAGFGGFWRYGFEDGGVDVSFWGFLPLFSADMETAAWYIHNLIGIIISLAVMFLSIFIYKKRDARTVGTPIASRVFFEVILVLGCFTVFSFFVFTDAAMWGVLIAGVIYLIINVIVSRAKISAKSFGIWIAKYAVTTLAFGVLMVVTIKTGGFGQIYSRPAAKDLAGAQFEISSFEYHAPYSKGYYTRLYTGELTSEQADQVMDICKKHIVKGRRDVSAFNIIFGVNFYRSSSNVIVNAESNTRFDHHPFPRRHFRERNIYDHTTGQSTRYFTLDYTQNIMISATEIRALINELKELDFVMTENEYNARDYDPEIGYSEYADLDEYYAG